METNLQKARIDLHCHSWASDRPALWLMQRLGCPESYTAPSYAREAAMQRGMDFVTITDHNSIEGVREIQHYNNVIVGEEVTTYFPGDVKVHVVCLDITEEQHREIQDVREDIHDFVRYLNENDILHFCAHPMHRVNGRLTWDHFEKILLLFKHIEILNGSRLFKLNFVTEQIAANLKEEDIERLSNKHGIDPIGERPWEKYVVGGTDDHSGLFVGTCCTEVQVDRMTKEGLLEGIRLGRTRPVGGSDGCLTLAHQVSSIAYQYYCSKIGPESSELIYILGRIFERKQSFRFSTKFRIRKRLKRLINYFRKPRGANLNLIEEIRGVISSNKALKTLFNEGVMTREEYNENVFNLLSDVLDEMILRVSEKPQLLHYFIIFAPTILASYFMTCGNLHVEHDLIKRGREWLGIQPKPKAAWFTDSFVNMDGVSKTCRAFLEAARKRGKDLQIITSTSTDLSSLENVVNFEPVKEFHTPGYEKVMLYVPSILKVLKYVEDNDFDSIVVSTPGPVGVMGLICAKLMRIPVHGIYHTDFPRIALRVSGDPMFGELALLLTRLFYRYADRVFSPSKWYCEDIQNLGIPSERTEILERWIDAEFFTPARRDESYWKADEECKLLFVGRISKDKNLDLLVRLYERLAPEYDQLVLHCVGDGPYYKELRKKTSSMSRFIMTGGKYGEDLANAYASSDLFVYPGLLDTFGNVVIEAQASGLPCVVMNEGGPQELILPNETGIINSSEEEFIDAVEKLIQDTPRRKAMGMRAAEHAAERFAEERIFSGFWDTITQTKYESKSKSSCNFAFDRNQPKVVNLNA